VYKCVSVCQMCFPRFDFPPLPGIGIFLAFVFDVTKWNASGSFAGQLCLRYSIENALENVYILYEYFLISYVSYFQNLLWIHARVLWKRREKRQKVSWNHLKTC